MPGRPRPGRCRASWQSQRARTVNVQSERSCAILNKMERIVAIGEAADVLGVSLATLRRWEAAGKLVAEHTAGGWEATKKLERLAASSALSACGEARSGAVRNSRVKRASKKQEPNGGGQLCAA